MEKKNTKDDSCDPTQGPTSVKGDSTADDSDESCAHVPKTVIRPVSKRIRESKNNLQRREDWYQRRTGGGT